MELHRFFRYAIEKMCKEKKSLNHFVATNGKRIGEVADKLDKKFNLAVT